MKRKDGIIIFLFLGIVCLVFGNILFGGKVFCHQDIVGQFHPWKVISHQELIKGDLTLWNPFSYCGMPLMANLQAGIFYPLGVLFYLFPFIGAFKTFTVLHFWLAGIFMYFLLRKWGISLLASLVAAIVFSLSPWMVTRIHFLSVLGTVIWLPLLLLQSSVIPEGQAYGAGSHQSSVTGHRLSPYGRSAEGRPITDYRLPILLGIVFAIAFLAGHPQYLLYGVGLMLLLAIFQGGWKQLVWAGVLALIIAGIQLIPAGEFIALSIRGRGVEYSHAVIWSFSPTYLSGLFFPFLHDLPGSYPGAEKFWITVCYVGILPLLLGVLGLVSSKGKQGKILGGVLGIIFIFSFGKYTPVYWLLWKGVMPLRVIRYPATGIYLFIFIWAILAAMGSEKVFGRQGESPLTLPSPLGERKKVRGEWQRAGFTLRLSPKGGRAFSLMVKAVIVVLIILDLWQVDGKALPALNNEVFRYRGEKTSLIEKDLRYDRFFHTPKTRWKRLAHGKGELGVWEDFRGNLYSNVGMGYRLFNIGGQDVRLKRYDEFLTCIEQQGSAQAASKLCGLVGVKYLFSLDRIGGDCKLVIDDKVKLYKKKERFPRVWMVPEAIYLPQKEILNRLNENDFSAWGKVIIEN